MPHNLRALIIWNGKTIDDLNNLKAKVLQDAKYFRQIAADMAKDDSITKKQVLHEIDRAVCRFDEIEQELEEFIPNEAYNAREFPPLVPKALQSIRNTLVHLRNTYEYDMQLQARITTIEDR